MIKLNIINIVVDALRFDVLYRLIYFGLAPNLSRIINNNSIFKECHALTNTTDSSLATIFTGLHPLTHGVLSHGEKLSTWETKRACNLNTLAKILRRYGYFNIAVDFLDRWHSQGFHIYKAPSSNLFMQKISQLLGFMTSQPTMNIFTQRISHIFESIASKTPSSTILKNISNYVLNHFFKYFVTGLGDYTNTKYFTEYSLNILKRISKSSKPFFLFIHYWNTHTPYYSEEIDTQQVKKLVKNYHREMNIPLNEVLKQVKHTLLKSYLENWFRLRKLENTLDVISQYYAAVLDIDKQIGKLIDFLEKRNLLENTMLIITGDHGESLGEHGIYFDHHGLYEVSLKVPLIIHSPKLINEEKLNIMKKNNHVTHLDIVPTLLDLLGLLKNPLAFDGQSLIRKKDSNPPFIAIETYTQTKLSVKKDNWKLITSITPYEAICRYCGTIHGGLNELYNLKNDPTEIRNVVQEHPDIFEKLRRSASKQLTRFKLYYKLSKLSTRLKTLQK